MQQAIAMTASPASLFFVKQTISNACGTIALIHAVINNKDTIDIGDGVMFQLFKRMKDLDKDLRAKVLEESTELFDIQLTSSHQGQSEVLYTLIT